MAMLEALAPILRTAGVTDSAHEINTGERQFSFELLDAASKVYTLREMAKNRVLAAAQSVQSTLDRVHQDLEAGRLPGSMADVARNATEFDVVVARLEAAWSHLTVMARMWHEVHAGQTDQER